MEEVKFEEKERLIDLLYRFHDRDACIAILNERGFAFTDLETAEPFMEFRLSKPIAECVFIDKCVQKGSKRIVTVMDLEKAADLEKIRLELWDFYFSDLDMVICASRINPRFVKGGKASFYLEHLYIKIDNVLSISAAIGG